MFTDYKLCINDLDIVTYLFSYLVTITTTYQRELLEPMETYIQTKQFQRCSKSLSRQSIHGYDNEFKLLNSPC